MAGGRKKYIVLARGVDFLRPQVCCATIDVPRGLLISRRAARQENLKGIV
jgi:hypothetical protein